MLKKNMLLPSRFLLMSLLLLLSAQVGFGQIQKSYIQVQVTPDHSNWLYKPGEPVKFRVAVTQSGVPVPTATVRYNIMPEKMKPVKTGTLQLTNGEALLDGGTMPAAGFLRCDVFATLDGKEYKGLGTAAFDPMNIQPTVKLPADFSQFWEKGKADLAAVPMDARMTLMPERCTENVNVYHVNLQGFGKSRLYGILCVPKKEGKYPALLQVPGAGIRPYGGDIGHAEKGVVTFQIGIHGIPVDMPQDVYNNLSAGALSNYPAFNLENKDRYYYKRVYLNCVRAVDFLASLPQVNNNQMSVMGGSQGGALSIVTAALDNRIKYLVAFYPALSDMTGYLNGRAGGWPHLFAENNNRVHETPDKINTVGYYDVVNFARYVKVPGFYSWGYNDETCPPTSYYSAYNVTKAPKDLFVVPETGHWTYPEQYEKADAWLMPKLVKEEPAKTKSKK
ncbi:acetylxylan esterase [Adhaeribacter rhizoryzae]|uniref:Acetylxylan esterase n=1 Tax=Adhaeribacter rhizoryzae TaxID=2607907 RepID=A0A5M6D104_9BACT|nr:acetylxylan esterase [Adhaeribacter rhizoryzae]